MSRRTIAITLWGLAGAGAVGLAAYLVSVGLDKADKVASITTAFLSIAALVLAVLAVRGTPPSNPTRPSLGDGVSNKIEGKVSGTAIQAGNVGGALSVGSAGEHPTTPHAADDKSDTV